MHKIYKIVKRTAEVAVKEDCIKRDKDYDLISIVETVDPFAEEYFANPNDLKKCERLFYNDVKNNKYDPLVVSKRKSNHRYYYRIKK